MKTKLTSTLLGLTITLLVAVCCNLLAAVPEQSRNLSLAERVAYQRAIENVYWQHRIWPKERPDRKPSLEAVMSQAELEKKVTEYLRNSRILEDQWQRSITSDNLQAEIDRMAQHTRQPEVLRELFAALGNDPYVIAECLARPALAERFLTNSYSHDQEGLGSSSARETEIAANYVLPAISSQPNDCDDSWTATSTTNAPSPRGGPTAVWTGTEMIVWGGGNGVLTNTGGRYNRSTDSWVATNTIGAPGARSGHTAVWTGTEMIIWGGIVGHHRGDYLDTGGRYNPTTDSWTATSTTNVPLARSAHTAVWTGSEMIVWGGENQSLNLNTGGRYNPTTDSWTATSTTNAPLARSAHTAVWTGSEMIVWGGENQSLNLNTGGRYDPSSDSWTATTTTNAPSGREDHTALWIDSEMIVWGGLDRFFNAVNTGGRYNPGTDSWTVTSTSNAPQGRHDHTAVWTGTEMIVWGGYNLGELNSGGRYNLSTDSWTATSTTNVPEARRFHTAVWNGSEMIVWGGNNSSGNFFNTGGRYNPATDGWTATTTVNAPSQRAYHTAVWTGSEMILWGGSDGADFLNSGASYCAQTSESMTLQARVIRQGGIRIVVLTWSPADGGNVNVLRNGVVVATTDDDGTVKDKLGTQTGTFTYQVCETDSGDCSNEVTVRVRGVVE